MSRLGFEVRASRLTTKTLDAEAELEFENASRYQWREESSPSKLRERADIIVLAESEFQPGFTSNRATQNALLTGKLVGYWIDTRLKCFDAQDSEGAGVWNPGSARHELEPALIDSIVAGLKEQGLSARE